MVARQGRVAKRYLKAAKLTRIGRRQLAGNGRAGEATVATGALTMGGGMFSTRISLIEMWLTISPVSWSWAQLSWLSRGRKASSSS